MSPKANNLILIRNKINEHYQTQHEAYKQTNKSNDLKLILQYIFPINKQRPKIKQKNEKKCEMEDNREYEINMQQKYLRRI